MGIHGPSRYERIFKQPGALNRVIIAKPVDRRTLEQEALREAGQLIRMLMSPGGRFPSRQRLRRVWSLFRQLDKLKGSAP